MTKEMDEESIRCIFPYWELETGPIITDPTRYLNFSLTDVSRPVRIFCPYNY